MVCIKMKALSIDQCFSICEAGIPGEKPQLLRSFSQGGGGAISAKLILCPTGLHQAMVRNISDFCSRFNVTLGSGITRLG